MKKERKGRKELEPIAPFIANLSFSKPDSAPPGFFEDFPADILKKVKSLPQEKNRKPLIRIESRFWAAAAGIAIIVGAILLYFATSSAFDLEKELASLSNHELANYLLFNPGPASDYFLLEDLVSVENWSEQGLLPTSDPNLIDELIEQYQIELTMEDIL